MPLGNGDIGINVWIDTRGLLRFYIGKTDTWGESGQLYKVGLVRVDLLDAHSQPLLVAEQLSWSLDMRTATIGITTTRAEVRLRVDACHPLIFLTARGPEGLQLRATAEVWRQQRRVLGGQEQHALLSGSPQPVAHEPDEIATTDERTLAVFHHNHYSAWGANLEQQGLADWQHEAEDPLAGNTFGYALRGEHLRVNGPASLTSRSSNRAISMTVAVLTCRNTKPSDWKRRITTLLDTAPAPEDRATYSAHKRWWADFWSRSHIEVQGDEHAATVTFNYAAQRFLNACAGRGAYPVKFNGSIFTVDWGYPRSVNPLQPDYPPEHFDADYRRWGPGYWHQNTRLPCWAMLGAGDCEMTDAFFDMYREALPLAEFRTRRLCGHRGAFFPEAMTFWGTYLEHHYGWPDQRTPDLLPHVATNGYMRMHHSSGLEVAHLALLRHRMTNNRDFLHETALPLTRSVLRYYDEHYPRKAGKIHLAPAQVLEQWWSAINPLPDIAGLLAVTQLVARLGEEEAGEEIFRLAAALQRQSPPLPMSGDGEDAFFLAAEWHDQTPRNRENPELYAVFPFLLCPPGSPFFATARRSFDRRAYKDDIGWMQDGIQAALLDEPTEAIKSIAARLGAVPEAARFPAFWGPNWDWIPDQDHGCTAMIALQLLSQSARRYDISPWRLRVHPPDHKWLSGLDASTQNE